MTIILDCFFFPTTPPAVIYALSLHDALPISRARPSRLRPRAPAAGPSGRASGTAAGRSRAARRRAARERPAARSEEHTSELQSRFDLVCRLLLEKKKKN